MDPFSTLGVHRNASPGTCKKAYNKLALKYHPDKADKSEQAQKQATQKFQACKQAYEACVKVHDEQAAALAARAAASAAGLNPNFVGASSSDGVGGGHGVSSSSTANPNFNPFNFAGGRNYVPGKGPGMGGSFGPRPNVVSYEENLGPEPAFNASGRGSQTVFAAFNATGRGQWGFGTSSSNNLNRRQGTANGAGTGFAGGPANMQPTGTSTTPNNSGAAAEGSGSGPNSNNNIASVSKTSTSTSGSGTGPDNHINSSDGGPGPGGPAKRQRVNQVDDDSYDSFVNQVPSLNRNANQKTGIRNFFSAANSNNNNNNNYRNPHEPEFQNETEEQEALAKERKENLERIRQKDAKLSSIAHKEEIRTGKRLMETCRKLAKFRSRVLGARFVLLPKDPSKCDAMVVVENRKMTYGRQLARNNTFVSNEHFVAQKSMTDEDKIIVEDRSSNGTWIDDERIPGKSTKVKQCGPGSVITCGGPKCDVRLELWRNDDPIKLDKWEVESVVLNLEKMNMDKRLLYNSGVAREIRLWKESEMISKKAPDIHSALTKLLLKWRDEFNGETERNSRSKGGPEC